MLDELAEAHMQSQQYESREWTQDEIREKLADYVEVPPEYWLKIRYGSHCRYFSKERGFRVGGFIAKNPIEGKDGDGKMYMKFQNMFKAQTKGYVSWVVEYNDLAHVYIKLDAAGLLIYQMLDESVRKLNDNDKKLAVRVKDHDTRIKAIEAALGAAARR